MNGGTRYSSNMPHGQCDGKSDAVYPGNGVNQHCAFNDVRYLWQDGSQAFVVKNFPAYGWIGSSGDTYIIHGSISDGMSYRVGWNNSSSSLDPGTGRYWGLQGDAYSSGAPPPPSGTSIAHTKILGGNFASCRASSARTQLHGGFAVNQVLDLTGVSYVDIQCLDITDFSSCGRSGQIHGCSSNIPMDDYSRTGLLWSRNSTHDTLTDVRIHGLAVAGMLGPTGDGVTMSHIDIIGNASSGWNADRGDGTTGTGTLLVQDYKISWNGCAEEYPIVDELPYEDCADDNISGYGDGFGTTTAISTPGWIATFDHGEVSYNTQDGLDALHLAGPGSKMIVTRTLAYGNMGQQLKIGGTSAILRDNIIYTNCNALRQPIPGTPPHYNARLSDFCRASDAGIAISVNDDSTSIFDNNIVYSASATALQVEASSSCAQRTCLILQRNNIFVGFRNNAASGYPSGGSGSLSNPIYLGEGINPYANPGSSFDSNTTFHPSESWTCPNKALHETHATCGNPHLVDETWHLYGVGNTAHAAPGSQHPAAEEVDDSPVPPAAHIFRHKKAKALGISALFAGACGAAYFLRTRGTNT